MTPLTCEHCKYVTTKNALGLCAICGMSVTCVRNHKVEVRPDA